jgi:hypothetical protein
MESKNKQPEYMIYVANNRLLNDIKYTDSVCLKINLYDRKYSRAECLWEMVAEDAEEGDLCLMDGNHIMMRAPIIFDYEVLKDYKVELVEFEEDHIIFAANIPKPFWFIIKGEYPDTDEFHKSLFSSANQATEQAS